MILCDRCGAVLDDWMQVDGRKFSPHRCLVSGGTDFLSFNKLSDYCNPNAKCPLCLKNVFYYQNVHGSRVYFDHAGIPWPKHECTDNAKEPIPIWSKGINDKLLGPNGETLECYKNGGVEALYDDDDEVPPNYLLRLISKVGKSRYVMCSGSDNQIYWDTLNAAPAFLVASGANVREAHSLYFINYMTLEITTIVVALSTLPVNEAQSYFSGLRNDP
jgi:hypothetical protein